ncbi:MAG: ankyrin repeat domain-containing protein, partial [Bacteroidales bacterium]
MTNRRLIAIGSVALALLTGVLPSLAQEAPDEWHAWIRKGEIAPITDALDKDPGLASRADRAGIPPLFWAALYGQRGVVELLLARGAEVNGRCHLGVPLHAAVVGGQAEILRALVAKGARVNDDGGIRLPPVVLGARRGSASAVETLIQAGAAVDARDAGGNTALLLAASQGPEAVVRILLARGADAGATNRVGITARDAAAREGHAAIAELLRGRGRVPSAAAPPLAGAYLGQERPGLAPRVFAPGVVSTERRELNAAFTPDGRTLFFSRDSGPRSTRIMMTTRAGETWQAPVQAAFSTANDVDMFVTADGQELYFCSNRRTSNQPPPAQGPRTTTPSASSAPSTTDIWVARKEGHAWGPAMWLGPEVNSTQADDYYPTVSRSGTLYFSSNRPGGLG